MDHATQQNPQSASPHDGPHAAGTGERAHEEFIPKDLKPVSTGKVVVASIVFTVMLVALFVVGYIPHHRRLAKLDAEADQSQERKPIVNVVYPKRESTGGDLVLPGDIRPLQQTSLFPRSSGYLKKLLVDIGDRVKAGQLLAEIEAPEVDAQLLQARAAVAQAQASVTKAQNDYDLAKTTLDRYQSFGKSGGVTQQQIDEKQNAMTQAQSGQETAKATMAASQADVQRLEALIGFQKITAPFDGTITARNYDVGALLSSSTQTPMFELAQTDTLRVFVNVPQSSATLVKVGQTAELAVSNYPKRTFEGKVTRSSDSLDPTTRTIKFEVNFPNKDGLLYAGMFGQIIFHLKPLDPPLVVPTAALVFNAQGLRLATVKDGKVAFKTVTVGRDFGTELEILNGIAEDEQIISNPGERLRDGVDVQIHQNPPAVADKAPATTKPAVAEATGR
ncbi:efflux RND transporter periplasmic adaptor subunit [soil metagenome]